MTFILVSGCVFLFLVSFVFKCLLSICQADPVVWLLYLLHVMDCIMKSLNNELSLRYQNKPELATVCYLSAS